MTTQPQKIELTEEQLQMVVAQVKAAESSKSPKKSKSKKKVSLPDETPPSLPVDESCYQTIHFYARESWQKALRHAKDEREDRAPTIRVFAHDHLFGEACDFKTKCKEIVEEN